MTRSAPQAGKAEAGGAAGMTGRTRPAFRDGGGWHIRGAESFSGSRSMRPRIADLKTFPLSQLSVTRRDDDAVDVSAFANNLGFGWTEAQRLLRAAERDHLAHRYVDVDGVSRWSLVNGAKIGRRSGHKRPTEWTIRRGYCGARHSGNHDVWRSHD